MEIRTLTATLMILVFLIVSADATHPPGPIIYVDADAPGAYDGSSWTHACEHLQVALNIAMHGDEIRVAQGTYKPVGDRNASFELFSGITLKGGYAGFGEPDPNARDFLRYQTVLTGDLAGNDCPVAEPCDLLTEPTRAENSYHVVKVTGSGYGPAILEGLTITAANAEISPGGGLYIYYTDVIITDCTFKNNSTSYGGGAMAFQNSRVIFRRCRFISNAANENGGAVRTGGCGTCRDSYAEFKDCRFINNYAGRNGGALSIGTTTLTNLINCIVSGNTAQGSGGGLYHHTSFPCSLVNCTFTGNVASGGGGGIHNDRYGPVTLTNCLLYGDTYAEIDGSGVNVSYSNIRGGWPGVGNIDTDPCFVRPGYWADKNDPHIVVEPNDPNAVWIDGDYHLQADSPCIDSGDPNYIARPSAGKIPTGYYFWDSRDPDYIAKSSQRDLDAKPRIIGTRVDMGGYEYCEQPALCTFYIYVDDDAPNDPAPGDPCISDPLEDGSKDHPFDSIQQAIDSAYDGDTIIVAKGTYTENTNFKGKNVVLTGTDPTNSLVVHATTINGGVHFRGTENPNCILTGLNINGYIAGFNPQIDPKGQSHTHATISHCVLENIVNGCGRVIWACDGTIRNCVIANISYLCLRPWPVPAIVGCHGLFTNCTMHNMADGIEVLQGGTCTIENCIIYGRSAIIVASGATLNISYCDLQGRSDRIFGDGTVNWGPGNIDTDPCFADPNNGDYHLKSQAGRWGANEGQWTKDNVTSPCIDAGNPMSPIGPEPFPNGGIINMGAYGGTAKASKSYFGQSVCETIVAGDMNGDCKVDFADFALMAVHWLD